MFNIKKISLIAFVLLFIGVAGSVLTVNASKEASTINEEIVFDGENISKINIDSENADIAIIPINGEETKVELHGNDSKNRQYKLNTNVSNGTLNIELTEKQLKFFNFNFMETGLTLNVYVSEKEYDFLKINNINGRIKGNQLSAMKIEAITVNGAIDLENMYAANVKVRSENGEIFLEEIEGDIVGNLINGKIFLQEKNLQQNIELENVNGEIEILTEEKPTNAEFDTEVLNGETVLFGENDRHLRIGNGDYKINLKTINGKITVDQQ